MSEAHRIAELAESIADGHPIDWTSLANGAVTDDERAAVEAFREIAGIGEIFATVGSSCGGGSRLDVDLLPGSIWGGLRVLEQVGRGRYGKVYRAWDPTLDRHVALKLLNRDDSDGVIETQIVEEGRLMARVRHPNVVAIHGAQRTDGVTGLWMEFVEGCTLAEELAEHGPIGPQALVAVGTQLGRALAAVHAAGLVHRDVKASNVLRDETGRVVLGDFGTGRELDEPVETREGLVGTPAYLAPEIFNRQPASVQSDIYSLGVLLFHLATGEYPYPARSLRALRDAHNSGQRVLLTARRPDLPTRLTGLIDMALEPDPTQRPASAVAFVDALEASMEDPRRRRRRRVWSAAVVVAAIIAAAGWFVWRSRPAAFNFAERDWVLVTAFDNRTNNPELDGSLEYALELELGDSSFVRVISRERIKDTLALMRKSLDTRVDADVGREVAVRDGQIRAVLAGQVTRIGGSYNLTARVLNPADGSIVASVVESAADDGALLTAITRAAVRVRARLGETLPTLPPATQRLPRVSTRSFKALQLYAQALPDLSLDANPKAAEQLLVAAVAEDPEFAVAYAALAQAIFRQRFNIADGESIPRFQRQQEVLDHLDRAVALSDRASVEDRYVITVESESIRGWSALTFVRTPGIPGGNTIGDPERRKHHERAVDAAQVLYRLHPESVWAVASLQQLNRELRLPPSADVPLVKALVSLRPNSLDALKRAADVMTQVGEFGLAREYLSRTRPLLDLPVAETRGFSPAVDARILLFEEAWRRNDIRDATAMAEALNAMHAGARPELAGMMAEQLDRVHITLGQFDRAEKLAASIYRADGRKELRLSSVMVRRKDPERMREFFARTFPDPVPVLKTNLSLAVGELSLDVGDVRLARHAIETIRARKSPPGFVEYLEGRLALLEGQPGRAIEKFKPICLPKPDHSTNKRCVFLADALVAAGNVHEAIRVLEQSSAVPRELRRPEIGGAYDWLTMRDRLAGLYRQAGRVSEAEPLEAELRLLLSAADADHPIKRRLDSISRFP